MNTSEETTLLQTVYTGNILGVTHYKKNNNYTLLVRELVQSNKIPVISTCMPDGATNSSSFGFLELPLCPRSTQ